MIKPVIIAMAVTMAMCVTVTLVMTAVRCLPSGQFSDMSKAGT